MITVTGTFLDSKGTARANTKINFVPESHPLAVGGNVITAVERFVTTNGSGAISVALDEGYYLVEIGNNRRDKFRILVPPGPGTVDISTLFIDQIPLSGLGWRIRDGKFQLKNVTTSLYHTVQLVGPAGFEQIEVIQPGEA